MSKYLCSDGNAKIEIEADSAVEAAEEYVESGDWGDRTDTVWINVWVQEVGADGTEVGDRERITVTLEAEVPDCVDGEEHAWESPYSLLGGVRENPGVWSHRGGVIIMEVCAHCGQYRVTDTWAQNMETGDQGLESIKYREADEASRQWLSEQDK